MGLGLGGKAKIKDVVEVGQVGAGKVGRTPDGMGRVGLAGGRQEVVQDKGTGPDVSILDSVVPPVSSEGSAITPPDPDPGRDRDEL